ncbi:MAG: hypothetical protein R3C16_00270 [Hyphomonadaceae bacterium]
MSALCSTSAAATEFYPPETLDDAAARIPTVTPADIQASWAALVSSNEEVLLPGYGASGHIKQEFPKWWKHALHLLIMADEAAGLGFPFRQRVQTHVLAGISCCRGERPSAHHEEQPSTRRQKARRMAGNGKEL